MADNRDDEMVRRALERVEKELLPKLKSSKLRLRTVVAVNVLAIVDRQIGRGEGPLPEEWERLRGFVKDFPDALALVQSLEGAIAKYDADLRQKIEE
jgi:hypothetical protein